MKDIVSQILQSDGSGVSWILPVNWLSLALALITAIMCGMVIYFIYRYFYRGSFYNDNFNTLLVLVTVITALVITTVSSNLALSLGMVGALSIVRFRAAIKDPLDVAFIFYAIAAGITSGAGLYLVALTGTIVIALVYLALNWFKATHAQYLLVAKYLEKASAQVEALVKNETTTLKNRTFHSGEVELTLQVPSQTKLNTKLEKLEGVISVILVEFNGDYLG